MTGSPNADRVAAHPAARHTALAARRDAHADDAHADDAHAALRRHALVGLAASTAIVAGSVAGGSTFVAQLPGAWFFGTPGGPLGSLAASGDQAPAAAVLAVYGGLIVLTRAWFGLLRSVRSRPGSPVRAVLAVVAVWSLPLLIGPPLFSRDLFSYAGLGEMVSHHIDPYSYGTGVLGSTPFSLLPGQVWANSPSPYGPTFLSIDGLLAVVSGHHVLPDLVLLRLVAVAGLALVAAGLPTLARARGTDPATAVALGVGSPLALMTLVAGGHNDALMIGLLVAGLAAAQRFGPVPGVVLCALAGGVKAPALAAVVFLGWTWAGPGASVGRRIATTLRAGALALATLAAVSWGTGLGWGWLRTLGVAGKVSTSLTPTYDVSRVLAFLAHLVQVPLSADAARTAVNLLALAVVAAIGARLVVGSPRRGVLPGLGVSLLTLALLSPILWAWYLTWGVAVLAPVASARLRRITVWTAAGGAFIGVMSLKRLGATLGQAGPLETTLLVIGLVTVAVISAGTERRAALVRRLQRLQRWRPAQPSPVGGRRRPGLAAAADGTDQRR